MKTNIPDGTIVSVCVKDMSGFLCIPKEIFELFNLSLRDIINLKILNKQHLIYFNLLKLRTNEQINILFPAQRVLVKMLNHIILSRADILEGENLDHIKSLTTACTQIKNVIRFKHIQKLVLKNSSVQNLDFLQDIQDLDVSNTPIIDLKPLEKTKIVKLNIRETNVMQIPYMKNIKVLNLSFTPVSEIPRLENLEILNINKTKIKKIMFLDRVKYISAYGTEIGDMPSLPCLETLLAGFSKIDINQIVLSKQIKTLDISRCNIKDISPLSELKNLKALNISFLEISNVSFLSYLDILDASKTDICDVSSLGNLKILNISYTNVKDVSKLGNIDILDISGIKDADLSFLGRVKTLCARESRTCNYFGLSDIQNLDLSGSDFPGIANCTMNNHSLDISRTNIEDPNMIGNVKRLCVAYTMLQHLGSRNVNFDYLDITCTRIKIDLKKSNIGIYKNSIGGGGRNNLFIGDNCMRMIDRIEKFMPWKYDIYYDYL